MLPALNWNFYAGVALKDIKAFNMISPHQSSKNYNALYHDFTEAYTSVHSLTREFYPMAKKFVEHTEPELSRIVQKISHEESDRGGPLAYQNLVIYMNHFDDFTLMANKLFADLKILLERSDKFMNRMIDLKMKQPDWNITEAEKCYKELIPELGDLVEGLKQMPERANGLVAKMKKLEIDWKKTKEKIQ
jgi:hypothetical protein